MRKQWMVLGLVGSLMVGLHGSAWSQDKASSASEATKTPSAATAPDDLADPTNLKPSKNMQAIINQKRDQATKMSELRQMIEQRRNLLMRENAEATTLRRDISELQKTLSEKRIALKKIVVKDDLLDQYETSYKDLQKSMYESRMKMAGAARKARFDVLGSPREAVKKRAEESRKKREEMLKQAREEGRIKDEK